VGKLTRFAQRLVQKARGDLSLTKLGQIAAGFAVVGIVLLGAIEYPRFMDRAKYSRARADLANLQTELDRYKLDYGYYPETLQQMLHDADVDPGMIRPAPPDARTPRDPWGTSYFYESNGDTYVLGSFGPRAAEQEQQSGLDLKLTLRSK
jgi:general secretion pathway protein G